MRKGIIIIFCILGMIVGVALGEYLATIPALKFLAIGGEIGVKTPIVIDLVFMQFTLGIWIKISICGVICMVIFACISKMVVSWLKI
jgi:hypothetical protein